MILRYKLGSHQHIDVVKANLNNYPQKAENVEYGISSNVYLQTHPLFSFIQFSVYIDLCIQHVKK